ncbi:MAG: hypothetical protein ACR5K4_00705 [Sodalis sp. (in: enterobacteria)]
MSSYLANPQTLFIQPMPCVKTRFIGEENNYPLPIPGIPGRPVILANH